MTGVKHALLAADSEMCKRAAGTGSAQVVAHSLGKERTVKGGRRYVTRKAPSLRDSSD